MIEDSSHLKKGQILKVEIGKVKDRISKEIYSELKKNPLGELVGYKMVDGNQFGLAIKLENGSVVWFFEEELSEINNTNEDQKIFNLS